MKEKIKREIITLADEEYRKFHSKLVPGEEGILGVRVPVLRKYAKELYKEFDGTTRELIYLIGSDFYEEIMLQGMIIGMDKLQPFEEFKAILDDYVPKINNWAICDTFCAGLKLTKKYSNEMWDYIFKYLSSDREFEVRFAVVIMMSYFMNDEYIDEIYRRLDGIEHEGYYVKMAAAWLISVGFVKYYDKTVKYMNSCSLDDFTYNKAIQKACESYRVTDERKAELRKLKR